MICLLIWFLIDFHFIRQGGADDVKSVVKVTKKLLVGK